MSTVYLFYYVEMDLEGQGYHVQQKHYNLLLYTLSSVWAHDLTVCMGVRSRD